MFDFIITTMINNNEKKVHIEEIPLNQKNA